MTGLAPRRWAALLAAVFLAASAGEARAQPEPVRDADRLSAEARDVEATDALRAAHLHEKADLLDPQPDRLAAAIAAATRALEPTYAMMLVERATARPGSPALEVAVSAAREKFGRAVGFLTVRCGVCSVTIDGRPGLAGRRNVVPAGAHVVEAADGAFVHRWPLSLESGESRDLVPRWLLPRQSAPPSTLPPQIALAPMGGEVTPSRPSPALRRDVDEGDPSLAPSWFWGSVALTGAVTLVTVASGIDAIRQHDRLDRSRDFFDAVDARRADYRTTILGTLAVGCGLGTAAVGIFAVDFGGKKRQTRATAAVRGPSVEVGGTF